MFWLPALGLLQWNTAVHAVVTSLRCASAQSDCLRACVPARTAAIVPGQVPRLRRGAEPRAAERLRFRGEGRPWPGMARGPAPGCELHWSEPATGQRCRLCCRHLGPLLKKTVPPKSGASFCNVLADPPRRTPEALPTFAGSVLDVFMYYTVRILAV